MQRLLAVVLIAGISAILVNAKPVNAVSPQPYHSPAVSGQLTPEQLAQRRAAAVTQRRILANKAQQLFLAYKARFQLGQIDRHIRLLNAAMNRISCAACRVVLQRKITTATSLRTNIVQTKQPVMRLGPMLAPRETVYLKSSTYPGGLHVLGGPAPSPTPSQSGGAHAAGGSTHGAPLPACQAPVIASLSVSAGQPGDLVIINGSGLGPGSINGAQLILSGKAGQGGPRSMNVEYWSPTQVIAGVPNITGVQASPGYIYVIAPSCQQGMGSQKSNTVQFQFNPELEPQQLPIASNDAAWGDFSCGIGGCGSYPGFGPAIAGDSVWAGTFVGKRADDQFFSGYQLINGWLVQAVDLLPEFSVTSSNGCQISSDSIGSASPHVDVHCYVSPRNGSAGYVLSITINGPVGVPYQ
jgi:hypothetical protein